MKFAESDAMRQASFFIFLPELVSFRDVRNGMRD